MTHPETYKVTCDQCRGRKFAGGVLCQKCGGEGEITVTQQELTLSQRAAKEFAMILLAALVAGLFIGGVLQWLGVFR